MAEVTAPPTRATWSDWIGDDVDPDTLMGRDELLARLAAEGFTVSEYDLKSWQRIDVIPLGIPHRRGRSTISLYPPEATTALAFVRQLQADRRTMDEIRQIIRANFDARVRNPEAVPLVLAGGRVTSRLDVPVLTATGSLLEPIIHLTPALPGALQEQIAAFARQVTQLASDPVIRAELRLVSEHGSTLAYTLATPTVPPDK
jgi:hypothetical protein